MKYSEVPRFVEAISNKHSTSEVIGKIYDTKELPSWVRGHSVEGFWTNYISHYKPATSVKETISFNYLIL